MSTVEERARKIVAEHLDVEPEKVTAAANYVDNLGADSLDGIELVMAMEEEFDVAIPDDDADKLVTFGQTTDYLNKLLAS